MNKQSEQSLTLSVDGTDKEESSVRARRAILLFTRIILEILIFLLQNVIALETYKSTNMQT